MSTTSSTLQIWAEVVSLLGMHCSHRLRIVPAENNYQPIEGNGGKENEIGGGEKKEKKTQQQTLDNLLH